MVCVNSVVYLLFFFFKQKTAYEVRISDWSSDVCSSDLSARYGALGANLVRFASLLKAAELDVTTTQLLGAAAGAAAIDVSRREDFRQALAANLMTDRQRGV